MDIAIIIMVTRPKMLRTVLDRLNRQTYDHKQIEIILIHSQDCFLQIPQTDIKIIRVVENDLHLGIRRNRGVERSEAEIIAFLDDDAIPPLNWVESVVCHLSKTDYGGVCGPVAHFDKNASLAYQLSGAATDSFFLEGFSDARAGQVKKVEFYNIPGCNCAIRRRIWEAVGGFNEAMFPYSDDIEFFFNASRMGFSFWVVPVLAVQHNVEPFPLRFLKKKIITRFQTGVNAILFHEIFWQMPFIKLAFMLYAVIFGICFFYRHVGVFFWSLLGPYLFISVLYSLKFLKKHPLIFLLLPFAFLTTHAANFMSFTGGLFYALGFQRKFQPVVAGKTERFQRWQN